MNIVNSLLPLYSNFELQEDGLVKVPFKYDDRSWIVYQYENDYCRSVICLRRSKYRIEMVMGYSHSSKDNVSVSYTCFTGLYLCQSVQN